MSYGNLGVVAEMVSLCEGDTFLTKSGKIMTFIRKKPKYILASYDEKLWNIHPTSYERLIERASKNQSIKSWLDDLSKGDFFFVTKKNYCLAFKFDRKEGTKVFAKHLVSNGEVIIHMPFSGGKIG